MSKTPNKSVQETGAEAGEILVGVFPRNKGLLIKIDRDQPKNAENGGRITGSFRVLDAGNGTYSDGIRTACETDPEFESADQFISLISVQPNNEKIAHPLNTNGLWRLDALLIRAKILV